MTRPLDLTDLPLILFERGSTGRQHVMDAFHGEGLSPRVDMETTNTEIIVRMVEARTARLEHEVDARRPQPLRVGAHHR